MFWLARCSKKTKETLEKLSLKLDSLELIQEDKEFYVHFCKEKFDYQIGLKAIAPEERPGNQDGRYALKADEKLYKVSYRYSTMKNLISERTGGFVVLKVAILSVSKLLSEVFTAQKVCVAFCDVPKEVVLPVVSTHFPNIHYADLAHKTQKLTSDDLSILLENCSIDQLRLDWSVEEGVKYRKSLKSRKIMLYKANWLTIECLLNMECMTLHAFDVRLTVEDVTRFLRKWLEGGFEKLNYIGLTHQSFGFSWQSVLDDFEKTLLNQQDREAHFHWLMVWNVWEIKRSDGKRAGVCASKEFTFKVL